MEGALASLFVRMPLLSDRGPIFVTSLNPNYLLRDPISKKSHPGGQGFNTSIHEDTNIQSIAGLTREV